MEEEDLEIVAEMETAAVKEDLNGELEDHLATVRLAAQYAQVEAP